MTRQFTPGPFHDGLLGQFRAYTQIMDGNAACRKLAKKYGMTPISVNRLICWTLDPNRAEPCPHVGLTLGNDQRQKRENVP